MSTKPFVYQDPFRWRTTDTEYYLLSKEHVPVAEFDGQQVLKVEPQALTLLAQQGLPRRRLYAARLPSATGRLDFARPEASDNDKYVALQFLRNSEIAAKGVLPTCQDTGTAIIMGEKGQRVWTGGGDASRPGAGVCTTPIPKITCATHRTRRWICIKRLTPAPNPAGADRSQAASTVKNISSCGMAKGGGSANKNLICTRRPKALITPGEAEKLPR
ncbi:fumarate hydratase [Klebsiella pneumoniae subsp. pneumoniae]|nr:fumarate hydratase [Klebsiella pneumoniae subsp. pneumoniae]